jgi:hypothetical protein
MEHMSDLILELKQRGSGGTRKNSGGGTVYRGTGRPRKSDLTASGKLRR